VCLLKSIALMSVWKCQTFRNVLVNHDVRKTDTARSTTDQTFLLHTGTHSCNPVLSKFSRCECLMVSKFTQSYVEQVRNHTTF
jgi:hypothetical protein